ncbi:MAG: glycosyl hydrolase family 65 protein, partial [Actinomycetota bacterium]|nr:glycosyl hydrolase family 65 protein [Actinomycetota bacterium]
GFGGMRDHGGRITFAPRLPGALSYLSFRIVLRDSKIVVAIDRNNATYRLLQGSPTDLAHHGEPFVLEPDTPVTLPIPALAYRTPPPQPKGCEPYRRPIRVDY